MPSPVSCCPTTATQISRPTRLEPRPANGPGVEAVGEIANHYLASRPEDRSGEDRTMVVLEVSATALTADPAASSSTTSRPRDVPAGTHQPDTDPAGTPQPAMPDANAQTCRVRGGAAIEVSAAQSALCDSRVLAIITDQYGEPLAVGRDQRLVTRAQRRALMIRDRCCQYPGCNQTRRLKAHHRISWLSEGRTDLDNMVLLCQWHHTRVHEDHITISRCDHPGCPIRWHFIRPDNSTIVPIVAGRDASSPWQPLSDAQGRVLPEPAREAARIRNDHRVAVFTSQQAELDEKAESVERRYGHIDCPDHPEAQRVFPVGGGAGFNLAACVDALFGYVTPLDAQAA